MFQLSGLIENKFEKETILNLGMSPNAYFY